MVALPESKDAVYLQIPTGKTGTERDDEVGIISISSKGFRGCKGLKRFKC